MDKFLITGPCQIKGKVTIAPSKNSAIPILASTLLFDKQVVIKNLPRVKDIDTMISLLKSLGSKITLSKDKLIIEIGAYKLKKVWEYFRLWSYISVERPRHPWYPAHIVVTSKGERVPLGDFLNEQEKEELVSNLENIIQELK